MFAFRCGGFAFNCGSQNPCKKGPFNGLCKDGQTNYKHSNDKRYVTCTNGPDNYACKIKRCKGKELFNAELQECQ